MASRAAGAVEGGVGRVRGSLRRQLHRLRPLVSAQVLRQDLLFAFRAKIDQMLKHFSEQSQLCFIGSSILLVYDGHRPAPAAVAPVATRRRSSVFAGGAALLGGGGDGRRRSIAEQHGAGGGVLVGGGGGCGGGGGGRAKRASVLQIVGSAFESALAVGSGGAPQRKGRRPSVQEVRTAGATCKLRMIDFAHVRCHRDRTDIAPI